MAEEIKEDLIISQIVKNPFYRDKVLPYLRPTFFNNEKNEEFFKILEILVMEDRVKTLDKSTLSLRYSDLDKINNVLADNDFPAENIQLLIKETEKWAKNEALREALNKSVDLFGNEKQHAIIGQLVKEALAFSFDKNIGLSYRKDIKKRFEFYNKIEQKLSTGYDMLDYHTFGGLQKKTLTIAAASSGLGKTLLGTNIAASMGRRGANGIYITLELDENLIARRVDSINTGIPYYDIPRCQKEVEEFIAKNVKGDLQIREFAPSKACALNLLSFIQEIILREGWTPDWVAVDYIQLVKPNNPTANMNSFEKYKVVAEELREMAGELDLPVVSFSQVQRSAYGGEVGLSHISDSIGIVNTADLVIGMSQTIEEEEEGFQTWSIIKNRLGRRGVKLRVKQDNETLRFNQVISPEEAAMLEDFRAKRKYVNNINKEADTEKDKELPGQVEDSYVSYIKEIDKGTDPYKGFN